MSITFCTPTWRRLAVIVLAGLMLGLCAPAEAAVNWRDPSVRRGTAIMANGEVAGFVKQGADVQLGTPNYDWWYGCSPTSAGMIMGYYDRMFMWNARTYYHLVPGGAAELSTFGGGGPFIANDAIASTGHIADYWVSYGHAGPDPLASGRTLPDDHDCLADFMGTSMAAHGNSDGGTSFWFKGSGAKTYPSDIVGWAVAGDDGMYGMCDYTDYRGYGSGNPQTDTNFYTQLLPGKDPDGDGNVSTTGFTFNDYKTEIDNGRPVMIHIEGHSMCGYGYNDDGANETVYVYDTWDPNGQNPGQFQWGTSYPYGADTLGHWGVTCATMTGGSAAFILREPPLWWHMPIEPPWWKFAFRWDLRTPQWDWAPYEKQVPPRDLPNGPNTTSYNESTISKRGDIEYDPEVGAWGVRSQSKEGYIDVFLENIADPTLVKEVFLQFRMMTEGDAECEVSLDTESTADVSGGEVKLVDMEGEWGIYEAYWDIRPQPGWEMITFKLTTGPDGGAVHIASIDAGTFCPEPATMGLLALGGLVALRRRRRT